MHIIQNNIIQSMCKEFLPGRSIFANRFNATSSFNKKYPVSIV